MLASSAISEPRKRTSFRPNVRPSNAVATASTPSATSVRMRNRRTVVRSYWPATRSAGS